MFLRDAAVTGNSMYAGASTYPNISWRSLRLRRNHKNPFDITTSSQQMLLRATSVMGNSMYVDGGNMRDGANTKVNEHFRQKMSVGEHARWGEHKCKRKL